MHLKKLTENFNKFLNEEDWQAADIAQALAEDFGYSPYSIPRWVEALVAQKPYIVIKPCFNEKKDLFNSDAIEIYDQNWNTTRKLHRERVKKFITIAKEELDVKLANMSVVQPATSWTKIKASENKAFWLGIIDATGIEGLTDKESAALIMPYTEDLLFKIRHEYSFAQELVRDDWEDYLYEFDLVSEEKSLDAQRHIYAIYKDVIRKCRLNGNKMKQLGNNS